MNVLALVPSTREVPKVVGEWKHRLSSDDNVSAIACGPPLEQVTDYCVHELERILTLTEYRRWRRITLNVFFKRLRKMMRPRSYLSHAYSWILWNFVASRLWGSFLSNIRSFDPDLVDVGWIPRNHVIAARLRAELPRVMVLTRCATPSAYEVDTSWRQYDPALKVSIVLPVYNGARYLRKSIDSCLAQSHGNIELVIVDDCSTDETPRIIAEYVKRDPRVFGIRNERNLRLPGALNVGFGHTTGELLSWTSHDNYYAPDAMRTMVERLCSWRGIDLMCSAFRYVDEMGREDANIIYLPTPDRLPFLNTVGPCFLYRRQVYTTVGNYREEMEYEEDYDYWLRASGRFNMMRLHIPLYYYRIRPDSMAAYYARHPELWGKVRQTRQRVA